MIWLSRSEDIDTRAEDDIEGDLREAEELADAIADKEGDLAPALEELDENEKERELDEFRKEMDSDADGWASVLEEYGRKRGMLDASKVARLDMVRSDVERYRMGEWRYGTASVPPLRYHATHEERVRIVKGDSKVSRGIRETVRLMEKLGAKKSALRDNLRGEAVRGPPGKRTRAAPDMVRMTGVEDLVVRGSRNIVEHVVPAVVSPERHSVVFQDLGSAPTLMTFRGLITGEGKTLVERRRDMLQQVNAMNTFLRSGEPLYFSSSLTNVSGVATRVILKEFEVEESLDMVDGVRFGCTLVECTPPEEGGGPVRTKEASHWVRYVSLTAATGYTDAFFEGDRLKPDAEDILISRLLRGGRLTVRS